MTSKPKHIVIVTHHYPPHVSGVGFIAQSHAERLAALGYQVTVITSDTAPSEKSYSANGVNVVRIKALNFSESWSAPFPIFSPRLIGELFKYVPKADIVHVHDAFYISSFWAAVIGKWYRKPIVLTQHVAMIAHPSKIIVAIEKMVYATTGSLIFRFSNAILVYNDRVKDFLVRRGLKEKITILPNGVDTGLFYPVTVEERIKLKEKFGLNPGKKTLLFVGRYVPKKGFEKVLAVRSHEYEIVCAGGDTPKGVFDGVVFLGKINQKTLAEAYQMADIFILPSESEGFPLSIQEAMVSGLPVITTKDPGYAMYGLDEKYVCFIDRPDEMLLRAAIHSILGDTKRLQLMSEYGERYAESNFGWSTVMSKLEGIYSSLLVLPYFTTAPKKIAFVSDAIFPFNKGGKEMRLYEISRRLVKEGNEVHIYTMQWWKGPKTILQEGVYVHAICKLHPLYHDKRRSISQALIFGLATFKLLFVSFDVLDVDHIPFFPLFSARIVAWLRGKKLYATWHEVWGREYWFEYMQGPSGMFGHITERLSFWLPNVIIANSQHTANKLFAVGVSAEVKVVPLGADLNSIYATTPGKTKSDIIYVGRLLSHKGVDLLVRAVGLVKETVPNIQALIVGSGPERGSIAALISNLGLGKNITLMGDIESSDNLYGLMKSSKMLVLPSVREGFGLVVVEANAAGIPVITTRHADNAAGDLVSEGINGLLAEPTAESIGASIQELLGGTIMMQPHMGIEKYDWDMVVQELEKSYV